VAFVLAVSPLCACQAHSVLAVKILPGAGETVRTEFTRLFVFTKESTMIIDATDYDLLQEAYVFNVTTRQLCGKRDDLKQKLYRLADAGLISQRYPCWRATEEGQRIVEYIDATEIVSKSWTFDTDSSQD